MRIKIIALGVLGVAVAYLYVKFNVIWTGEKIELKELGTIELSKGKEKHDFFDDEDWLVITGEEQRKNWIESGYSLPLVDFRNTFIVLSNHKIRALYKRMVVIRALGYPMVLLYTTILILTKGRITFM